MTIRGMLFDIGDTLVAAKTLQEHVLSETVHALAAQGWLAPEHFIRAYHAADREPHFDQLPDLNHLYSDPRVIARACETWLSARFLRVYRATLRKNLRPDARQIATLTALRARGIKLGIVSNGTTVEQLDQLARLKIKKFFDPILISQAVGIRKPDPRILEIAARQWRFQPREILVIGDRPDWEVLCAKRAGMLSALTTEFVDQRKAITRKTKPELVIRRLEDLIGVI